MFIYNIDEQRKHKNNYMRFETKCSTNPNISVIKGYIKKMSLLPNILYNNSKSLSPQLWSI